MTQNPAYEQPHLIAIAIFLLASLTGPNAARGEDPFRLFGRVIEFDVFPQQTETPQPTLDEMLTGIFLDNIPDRYEDTSEWGMTSERWDGLKISLDGFRIKTKRRKKTVNHGTWKMYRINLVEPDKEFRVRLENGRMSDDGFIEFDLLTTARLHAFGRLSKWIKGVQLYSFSADADAVAQLRLNCRVAMGLDVTKLPPDIVVVPEVTGADLQLVEFRLRRISDLGGDLAEPLSGGVRRVLERKIAEKRDKMVDRMNRKIREKDGDLRLSLHDLAVAKWREVAGVTSNN